MVNRAVLCGCLAGVLAGACLSGCASGSATAESPERGGQELTERDIQAVADPARLLEIARTDPSPYNRRTAVLRLESPEGVIAVLREERDPRVVFEMWQHLLKVTADGSNLSAEHAEVLARNARSSKVRGLALERVNNQSVLRAALELEQEYDVRRSALKNLTDVALLAKIARSDASELVRAYAVSRARLDQATLAELVRSERDSGVVAAIVALLKDEELVRTLALDKSLADQSRITLVHQPAAKALATRIVSEDGSTAVRASAVSLLDDAALVLRLAKSDPEERVRDQARYRLVALRKQERLAKLRPSARETDMSVSPVDCRPTDKDAYRCGLTATNGSDKVTYWVRAGIHDPCTGGTSERVAPGGSQGISFDVKCIGPRPVERIKSTVGDREIRDIGKAVVETELALSSTEEKEVAEQVAREIGVGGSDGR